jgi:hypothetical protein
MARKNLRLRNFEKTSPRHSGSEGARLNFPAGEILFSLMAHKICGEQFRMFNRWFMGEPVMVEEWFQTQSVNPLNFMDEKEKASHQNHVKETG